MRVLFRSFLYLCLTIGIGAALADFCQKQTKGFYLHKIFSSYPPTHPSTPIEAQEALVLQKILSQPFYFLKKGQQCFVFVSQDNQYVLKLLRWDKLEAPPWMFYIPFYPSGQIAQSRLLKQEKDFASYDIAFTHLREETGLIFVTLAPQPALDIPLKLYDNLSIEHVVPASKLAFILQKKVEDFFPYFTGQLLTHRTDDLQPFFLSFVHLLHKRSVSHIFDPDISLEYNMGISEGKPVLFDIGNLRYELSSTLQQADLVLQTLQKRAPSLYQWLYEQCATIPSQELEKNPPPLSLSSLPQ